MNEEDFDKWFTGFFDGEGYFNVQRKEYLRNDGSIKIFKSFSIAIALAENDVEILKTIRNQYGGRLSRRIKQNAFPNAQPQWTWYLGKRDDVIKMLSILENLKTSNKVKRFIAFREELYSYIH